MGLQLPLKYKEFSQPNENKTKKMRCVNQEVKQKPILSTPPSTTAGCYYSIQGCSEIEYIRVLYEYDKTNHQPSKSNQLTSNTTLRLVQKIAIYKKSSVVSLEKKVVKPKLNSILIVYKTCSK